MEDSKSGSWMCLTDVRFWPSCMKGGRFLYAVAFELHLKLTRLALRLWTPIGEGDMPRTWWPNGQTRCGTWAVRPCIVLHGKTSLRNVWRRDWASCNMAWTFMSVDTSPCDVKR